MSAKRWVNVWTQSARSSRACSSACAVAAENPGEPEEAHEVFRSADYEERIRSIQNAPLRTPKPDVPPLPGVTYVNPWT